MQRSVLLVLMALLIVVLASASTYGIVLMTSAKSSTGYGVVKSRRFDVFEGYRECELAVRRAISGNVIGLESDDRAAKYSERGNLNTLFFTIDYSEQSGVVGYRGGDLKRVYAGCEVSAETNRIETVKLRPAGEEDYTEVIRVSAANQYR